MTAILTVSIDYVEASTLRGRVHVINPDVPYVPQETVFPLSLLAEAWKLLDNGYWRNEPHDERGDRCPFTEEQAKEITTGMRLKDELSEIFDLILGKEIRVTEDGYLLADDGETVLEPRRKAADVYNLSGGSRPGYSVMTHGDEEEFERRATEIVTSYEVSPYRNVPPLRDVIAEDPDGVWTPEELDAPADLHHYAYKVLRLVDGQPLNELPYAEISVTVSDAGYLEHLAAGMRWSTTMTGEVC